MNVPIRSSLEEASALAYSLAKWIPLAVGAGVIVGAAAAGFLLLLEGAIRRVGALPPWRHALLPLGLFLSWGLVAFFAPDAAGHGTEKVIEAIHRREGRIPLGVVPVKLIATILTLASGGSAGKEGPCAQIGAGLMSSAASLLRFDGVDRKKLVVCGISAGFASVFGTPLAGAVFGVEVLTVGQMLYDVLLPSFLSGVVAYLTAVNLGVTYSMPALSLSPDLSFGGILWAVAAGLFFGGVSRLHIGLLAWGEGVFREAPLPRWGRPLAGGAVLLLLAAAFGSSYLGLGTETIDRAVRGGGIPLAAFLLKSLFMAVTLSCGGSGGVVTPTFFVGATAGSAFARVLGRDPGLYSALGLVGVLAAAANTPIAATVMAAELFGGETAALAGVACVVAFMAGGHRSLYPSQILARPKSRAFVLTEEPDGGVSREARPRFSRLYGVRLVRYLRMRWAERRKSRGL